VVKTSFTMVSITAGEKAEGRSKNEGKDDSTPEAEPATARSRARD